MGASAELFGEFPAISGYAAYTYHGNPDFDMFCDTTAYAIMTPDGEHLFAALAEDAKNAAVFQERESRFSHNVQLSCAIPRFRIIRKLSDIAVEMLAGFHPAQSHTASQA